PAVAAPDDGEMSAETGCLPAIAELAAEMVGERREASSHKVRVVRADRGIRDPQPPRRLEAESGVVARIAQQQHQRPACQLSATKQLGHQDATDALPLTGRQNRQRSHTEGLAVSKATPGGEYMPEHDAVIDDDKFKGLRGGAELPGPLDNPHLCLSITVVPPESRRNDLQDCPPIAGL